MLFNACSLIRAGMRLPDPVAFTISGVSFYWFGVLFAAGIIVALAFTYVEVTRRGLDQDTWIDLCLVLIPCGIVGARLWYVLGHLPAYRGGLFDLLMVWDGGLSIYGALVFCLAGLFIYARAKKVRLGTLLDTMAPGIVLAQAVIIWGDFFQQRDYGHVISSSALQWFPFAVLIEPSHTVHYAVFFYEFLVCLAIFALLWFVIRKRATHRGEVFAWYLTLFFSMRFLLNLMRVSDTTSAGLLKPSQLFCLLLFLVGLTLLLILRKRPPSISFAAATPADTESPAPAASPIDTEHAPVVEAGDEKAPLTIEEAILAAENMEAPATEPSQPCKQDKQD